jgi:hypothetical protein
VKAFGIRPGDLITITYGKEGFERQPFRVLKISPASNYRTTTITAQIHDDAWYADNNGQSTSGRGGTRQAGAATGIPRPLVGAIVDANGDIQLGVEESESTGSDGTIEAEVSVSFVAPAPATSTGPGVPLVSLAAIVNSGGTLKSGEILYYTVSGLDDAGNESAHSFVVAAVIAGDNSQVTLTGLSFAPGTTAFHIYRGKTPQNLLRIASNQPVASQFTDTGLAPELIAPPDANFDHANFYWRMELQPELPTTIHSRNTVGNGTLQMQANAWRGMTVRITRGMGAGQENTIAANDPTTITIAGVWNVEPDVTSVFAVAETGWHFGALARSSPVKFVIPNLSGEVIHLTGRAANSSDVECAPELSPLTRWQIGGAGFSDAAVPPAPLFGLGAGKGGVVELSGISFPDLTDTSTISAGTLTIHYWDELESPPATVLATGISAADQSLTLGTSGTAEPGSIIQIEAEILTVTAIGNNGTQYSVTRGTHDSPPAAHAAQTPVYHLAGKTVIAPFSPGFFGSPYGGSWNYPVLLPNARVGSAELFVTNKKGDSPKTAVSFTQTTDYGLRTLSGGQYSIQVSGFMAVDQCAAPALIVEEAHAVRDVYAILGTAADAAVQLQLNVNGAAYCELTFAAGAILSNSVDGFGRPPLEANSHLTLSILSVGQTYPGADLTVVMRL